MGVPGDIGHPAVQEATEKVIRIAKQHGHRVAMPGPAEEAGVWAAEGADILFCGSDTACLRVGLRQMWEAVHNTMEDTEAKPNHPADS
jgi:2-keto-3-deoxy-L-rhamnonate aldolase RhmA